MKKIFTIVAMTLLWIASLWAQVPQKLTYQAVIRDVVGNVVNNQDLAVQISILQGSLDGPVVYSENHTTSTTVNGVITLEVGGGKTSYDFTSIDWSNGPFYIRSTAELNGKSISVTSQLLSVPYALYAQRSFFSEKVDEKFLNDIIDAKIQSALEEKEAEWQSKIEALEAALDSISAQLQVPPVDTIPSDTIPTDTIPADTVNADTAFKSAAVNGVLPGKFSIGEGRQVHFSRGIMQYHGQKGIIKFAETQYDDPGKRYMDFCQYPPKAWIDHFEHGTLSDMECSYYAMDSEAETGFAYIDNSAIENVGKWDVLKYTDWYYILSERKRADSLYSKAEVAGVKGYVLLPDDWTTPSDLTFTPKADYSVNVYDKKTWEKMEALGAVFMPCDSYWSWGLMCAYLDFSVDHEYPIRLDESWYEKDFIVWDQYAGRSTNAYRLVVSDSMAAVIMSEEPTVEEMPEVEESMSNYLPEPADLTGVDMKAGLLSGKFSVSETKQVNFSQGNLQYNMNSKVWHFAERQYEHIQSSHWWANTLSMTSDGWVDNFTWASSGFAFDPLLVFGYDESYGHCLRSSDVAGTKYDWGVNNPIINGGNTPNIWRTLTHEEWEYLMKRKANGIRLCSPGSVCGRSGMILLPDNWDFDADLPYTDEPDMEAFASFGTDLNYNSNVYTEELWSRMEAKGAVFLPSAGLVMHDHFWGLDEYGRSSWPEGSYWSSSQVSGGRGWAMGIYMESMVSTYEEHNSDYCSVNWYMIDVRHKYGCSVRLVRDVTE